MSTYAYNSLTGFSSTVDASTAGAAIAALDNGFNSTPKQIVDAARAGGDLHAIFTWPGYGSTDAHVSEEDRIERAALLLRSIVVSA